MTADRTLTPDVVVIERTFGAPPEQLWRMWTDPHHFTAWYGPHGVAVPVAELDVRVGGERRVCMEADTPDGRHRMWFTGEYVEVVEARRLVYTESMSDEHGNRPAADAVGGASGHPATTRVTVEFEAFEGGTRMTLTHEGIPAGSTGEAGWRMAFDQLAEQLADRVS